MTCESCGRVAKVKLADGSRWCWDCHAGALRLGYDTDTGTALAEATR